MKRILLLLLLIIPINIKALDNVSVLYYKYIDNCEYDTCISNNLFNLQIDYLKCANYNTISLDDFLKWKNNEITLNGNNVLIVLENENNNIKLSNSNIKINYLNDSVRYVTLNKPADKNSSLDEIPVYLMKKNYDGSIFKDILNGKDLNPEYDYSELSTYIPVLNYHFLGNCGEVLCLNENKFEEHLKYLTDSNYKTLTLNEYIAWKNGELDLPKKSVLITFDDGAAGTSKINGNYLIPLIEKYNINATLFLITSFWDIKDYISPNLEIESHTHNLHNRVNGWEPQAKFTSKEDIKNDIKTSIDITKSHKAFAYPFYYYDQNIIDILKEFDFKVAFVGGDYSSARGNNNYLIPRKVILSDITLEEFINFLEQY